MKPKEPEKKPEIRKAGSARRLALVAALGLVGCRSGGAVRPNAGVDQGHTGNPTAAKAPAEPPATLTVMTFNIRLAAAPDGENGWEYRKDFVARLIRESGPDTVGLQEAEFSQIQHLEATLPEYRRIGVGRDDGQTEGEFSAILYRADRFDVAASGTFWFSDTPETPGSTTWGNEIPRICTWGRFVDKRTGRAFQHFNVHLDHRSQPSREKSVQAVVERIMARSPSADPVVLTGDLNAGEDNPAILYLRGLAPLAERTSPLPLVDTFRQLNPTATEVGTFHGFKGRTDRSKIDFVFVSPSDKTLRAEILHAQENGRYPSDHFPVIATFEPQAWRTSANAAARAP